MISQDSEIINNSNTKPLISVILPVFNSENNIAKCIQSVLDQSYVNFELILVDDGSIDRTSEIYSKFIAIDNRIRVFRKTNEGVSAARNLGLDQAKGEWITFIDSDDYVNSNWLDNFINLIDSNVDIVCQGFMATRPLCAGDEDRLDYGFCYSGSVLEALKAMHNCSIVGYLWVKIFKKSIVDKYNCRFDTKLTFKEDEDFVLQFLRRASQIRCTDTVGYYYAVPNWEIKYIVKSCYIYEVLWKDVDALYANKEEEIVYSYLYAFINSFLLGELIPTRLEVLRIRKLLGKQLLKTSYPFILKWIWYIDRFAYFSTLVVLLYRWFKN